MDCLCYRWYWVPFVACVHTGVHLYNRYSDLHYGRKIEQIQDASYFDLLIFIIFIMFIVYILYFFFHVYDGTCCGIACPVWLRTVH